MSAMQTVALARHAMATRFEIVLHGDNPVALRAAGEEALDEIERLEAQLSLYRPTSEIAHLNARAADGPVRVSPDLFRLLQHAQRLHQETDGAFDVTIAPLMRCWGFMGGSGKLPDPDELAEARARTGMQLVELRPADFTVRYARAGVMLDLGAIGKGYAIERTAAILRDEGITRALLHGGTSTVYAIGSPPGAEAWNVAIEYGEGGGGFQPVSASEHTEKRQQIPTKPARAEDTAGAPNIHPSLPAIVPLKDEALSVSAVWGKSFQSDNRIYGHVLDPRTGQPTDNARLAAVILPSATETDALSTALLVAGRSSLDHITGLRSHMRTLVAGQSDGAGGVWVEARGITPQAGNFSA
jgi:thiamine biosynthesis lipoprotein